MDEEELKKIKDASINSKLLYSIATGDTSELDSIEANTVNAKLLKYIALNGGAGGGAFIKVGEVSDKSSLPTSYSGSKGDYYLDTTTGNWWVWNGSQFYEKENKKENNSYFHTQTTASTTWKIQHNLNTPWYELSVLIIDSDNNRIYGNVDVDNCTDNVFMLKFDEPISGKAIVKK